MSQKTSFAIFAVVLLLIGCKTQTLLEKDPDTLSEDAMQGDMNAAHALCFRYSTGTNLEANDDAAFEWCSLASSAQNPKSMTLLADLFFEGRGTEQDYHQAAKLYYFAAERGIEKAMYRLYYHFEEGLGVTKDTTEAHYYLNRAAERGYLPAIQLKQKHLMSKE